MLVYNRDNKSVTKNSNNREIRSCVLTFRCGFEKVTSDTLHTLNTEFHLFLDHNYIRLFLSLRG
jgi:hypothetical protein